MSVPSFLEKAVRKGGLKNTESGFELALRNNLAPGTLIGMPADHRRRDLSARCHHHHDPQPSCTAARSAARTR